MAHRLASPLIRHILEGVRAGEISARAAAEKWSYIWAVRKTLRSGDDGRIPIGPRRVRLEVPPRTALILRFHPSGHTSVLAQPPAPNTLPILLFTNRPTEKSQF